MKKFVFSAIAMMAFSVGGFASVKEVELLESIELEFVRTCYDVAVAAESAYILAMGPSYTPEGGYQVFSAAYDACEADGGPN